MSSTEWEYQQLSIVCQRLNVLFKRKFMFCGAAICGIFFTLAIAVVLIALAQLWLVCSVIGFFGVVYIMVDYHIQSINSEIDKMLAIVHVETIKSYAKHSKEVYRKEG